MLAPRRVITSNVSNRFGWQTVLYSKCHASGFHLVKWSPFGTSVAKTILNCTMLMHQCRRQKRAAETFQWKNGASRVFKRIEMPFVPLEGLIAAFFPLDGSMYFNSTIPAPFAIHCRCIISRLSSSNTICICFISRSPLRQPELFFAYLFPVRT